MKKVLFFMLVITLSVTLLLGGCTGNRVAEKENEDVGTESVKDGKEAQNNEEEKSIVTAPGEFPIVKDKVELDILVVKRDDIGDMETNQTTTMYEDMTNVHINWEQVINIRYEEKINVILASGDYPDIFMNTRLEPTQVMVYGSQGVFLPLNDLIEKHGFHMKKMFEEEPRIKNSITANDGNIYSLPYISACYQCSMALKMWVYKPWMEKLNIKDPATTEDFYQMLKAFKEDDPNENGEQDEIPLAGAVQGYRTYIGGYLMNAFIFNDTDMNAASGRAYLMVDNGKIEFVANKPEWKEGLKYIQKLYTEGLIAPETFTQDRKQFKKLGENPVPILGAAAAGASGNFTAGKSAEKTRFFDYKAIPPLEGPGGVKQTPYFHSDPLLSFMVTSECEYPEVAVRWADWWYSREGTITGVTGIKGIHWTEDVEEGDLGQNGKPATWKNILSGGGEENGAWLSGPKRFTPEIEMGKAHASQPFAIWHYTHDNYEPYANKDASVPMMFFDEDKAMEVAQLEINIKEMVSSYFASFVTGAKDVDGEWDSYVNALKEIGVDRYVELYQQSYDIKY